VSDLGYLVEVVVAFGLVIFLHELGHFLAAKWCGVHVRKFAIGFGPPILKWQPGETQYSLRPIPLGGFVDLAGEHPDTDEEDDPRALWRRPAWQRAVVFSAGVGMNAVLALLLFTIAPIVGMQVPAPVVGSVVEDSPADRAGLRPGDRILRLGGEPVQSFNDVQFEVALSSPGTAFSLLVERPAEDGNGTERVPVTVTSRKEEGDIVPVIGIERQAEPVIVHIDARSVPAQAGLEEGDRILAVGGQPVHTGHELREALEAVPAGPLTLTVERQGEKRDLRVVPSDLFVYEIGMMPPVLVRSVTAESPAQEAGIQAGDRIVAVGDHRWPTVDTLVETIEATSEGKPLPLTLRRETGGFLFFKGQVEQVDVTAHPRLMEAKQKPMLGIRLGLATGDPVQVGHVEPGGPAEKAGLRSGDIILEVQPPPAKPDGDTPDWEGVGDWSDLLERLHNAEDKAVGLRFRRGQETLTATLAPVAVPQERLTLAGAPLRPMYVPLPRIGNPLTAAKRGINQTLVWFTRAYGNLVQILRGEVGREALGGPVAIVQISYQLASYGVGTFMNFWGMISVFLAVINFLPLPPFDGGHVVFVLIDKLKGSPVSMKVRTWIWGAGWAGLLALFVLITWQDIDRLW